MTTPIPVVINAILPPQIALSVRNNADWTQPIALYSSYAPTAPWSLVAPWGPSLAYQSVLPASVVTYLGDLYVPSMSAPQTWISAATFASEAANWVLIAAAVSYQSTPFNLTGAVLKMTVATLDANGNIAAPLRPIITLTSDGSDGNPISIVPGAPLTNGTFALDLLAVRAAAAPPGVYGYDLIIIQGGVTTTAMFGLITVAQGAA